ncbi:MAG: response regulator transcription factor [Rubritepida sp.]|nr:response regulator transcription factor [Rubritepida sp.]
MPADSITPTAPSAPGTLACASTGAGALATSRAAPLDRTGALRLLLVEDHAPLADALSEALRRAGFAVDLAPNAATARDLAALGRHDLVLLDLGLPDGDGLALLAEWRRRRELPVIVLTARGGLDDRLAGLDSGADDYVVKPVQTAELIARCRAVLRRPGERLGAVLEAGALTLDTTTREASFAGAAITLGRRETGVLEQLLRRRGRVVPRRALEEALYGVDDEVGPNALEAAVSRLRRALETTGAPVEIRTVRGVGWMLAETGAR